MNLKRLSETLPVLGAYFILMGYLKLYLYYDHWNISIIDYLNIGEITLLFLSDVHVILSLIIIYIFPVTIGLIISQAMEIAARKKAEKNNPAKPPSIAAEIADALDQVTEEAKGFFMIICTVWAIVFIILFFVYNQIWLLYMAMLSILQLAFMFVDYLEVENEKLAGQIIFVLCTFSFTVLVARYDIYKTERNSCQLLTIMKTKDSPIISTPNNLYIGKTNNYYFMYNTESKRSQILKAERVDELLIMDIR